MGSLGEESLASAITHTLPISAAARPRARWFAAPLAAMLYPLPLAAFHACVSGPNAGSAMARFGAGIFLLLAFLAPGIALLCAVKLAAIDSPTVAELRARRVAVLAVAVPAVFTLAGVLALMLKLPGADVWGLAAFWAALGIFIARSDRRTVTPSLNPPAVRLRVAHGVVAAAVLLVFLAGHLINHLFGLAGRDAHIAVMKTLRHVYRAPLVEPVLLLGLLFLMLSGSLMAWKYTARATDRFRALQTASGVYLFFFLISHVNAVLVVARQVLHIDPNWDFATGAPAGLIRDAWNIRLVPYYWLGVFFVLLHLASGARKVLLEHSSRTNLADGVVIWGAALSAMVSTAILAGMCGLRLHS
jgi:hypothetical protein